MRKIFLLLMFMTISIISCVAQKIDTKPQLVSMRGYDMAIPYTWTIYDNFDPAISDFRFVAIDGKNGVLEVIPISENGEYKYESVKDVSDSRLFSTDIQLDIIPNESKSKKYQGRSFWEIASNNKQDNTIGEIAIVENNGYSYAIMYYGNKSFCKSKELNQALKSFTLTNVPEIDPEAGISDSIKAQIPVAIDMDKFAQTSDGWYKYNNWDVQFEFPTTWVVNRDDADSGMSIFMAGNEDNNDYINLMIATSLLATEQSLDSMVVKRQSENEVFAQKETKEIGKLSTINYPFEIKEEGQTMLYGEIILFDDTQRYFYVIVMSHNKMSENTDITRLLNSFQIGEWTQADVDNNYDLDDDQIQIDVSDE